jgi:CRP-like cAMP-binding protein
MGKALTADPMRVFGHVRARDVRSLASPVLEVVVPAGTRLMSEGDEVGTFFVIRAGQAEISRRGQTTGTLDAGDCFGESDPAAPSPQPFTVTAGTELRLMTFSSLGIARLCALIPGARESILEHLPGPGASAAGPVAERGGVHNGDGAVVRRDPAELAHEPQCSGNRLARGAGPPREFVLSNR